MFNVKTYFDFILTFLAIFLLWRMLRDKYQSHNYRPSAQDHRQPLMIQRVHSYRYGTTLAVELCH